MKWTQAQQNAIDIPVSNIIVSAAAGSGKTAVMAERIINRLTGDNPTDIDRILVVTYTNAAASEIKERVMKKILEKLSQGSNETLQKQLVLLSNAHFCTIHSFCLELIKKHFYMLGIDPAVKTGDEAEISLILKEAVSNVINSYLEDADDDFNKLINSYANGKEFIMENIILDLYKFSRTMPYSAKWLDELPKSYIENSKKAGDFIASCAYEALSYAVKEYEKAINLIEQTGTCEKWLSTIVYEKNEVNKILSLEKNYENYYNALKNMVFSSLPQTRNEDAIYKQKIKDCRDRAKGVINDDLLKYYFLLSPENIEEDNKNIYPYVVKLIEAVKKTGVEFSRLKKDKNLIDFSDYEHMVLSLLVNKDGTPSEIAYSVSNDFDEIYVDEFQDCNNIQNEIFSLISGAIRMKPNLFCVGDMKQSIYKFRDANPLNFRKMCDDYPLYNGDEVNYSNKILLNANFRSRPSILNFVNSVFSQLMSKECGELLYNQEEMLNPGAQFKSQNKDADIIDIDIIDEQNLFGDDAHDEENSLDKTEAEALHIAQKIKKMVDEEYRLYNSKAQCYKNAQYSDFVILLRSTKKYVASYEKVFSKLGIPLYCDSNGYFNTQEIEFLIYLLKIIDNPDDDIALVSVMKNPIFLFNENELLEIKLAGFKNASFYKCVKKYIKTTDSALKIKLNEFVLKLEDYHQKSKYMETDEFLSYVLSDINYLVYLSVFEDSKTRIENVNFLIQKAKSFEKNNFKGIFSFIKYVENIKGSKSDDCAKTIGEGDNVVRLMSIHKSKGLEFPVVILAGMGNGFNDQDIKRSVVFHKDFGIGADSIYANKGYKLQSLNKISIKHKIRYESVSEELRVLYVALTRPVDKLIITGTVKNGPKFLRGVEAKTSVQDYSISPYTVLKSSSFLEMILLASVRSAGCELGEIKDGLIFDDGIKYNICIKNMNTLSLPESTKKPSDWQKEFKTVTQNYENMRSFLNFEYPYKSSSSVSGNISVTEIKKMKMEQNGEDMLYDDVVLKKPTSFANSGKLYGSALGTLVHLCMEKLDFSNISAENDVIEQIKNFVSAGFISQEEFEALDISKFIKFSQSPLCRRMIENVSTLKKEVSFKILTDIFRLYGINSDDLVVVQGTIDAYFEDTDGKLVLVDYKTDKVTGGTAEPIASRYRIQLETYASALEKILGKKVKEKHIYLFDTGETLSL